MDFVAKQQKKDATKAAVIAAVSIGPRDGPMRLAGLPAFVNTRGGGYFFLPGRRTLQYLVS